jgi:hypothetical protein
VFKPTDGRASKGIVKCDSPSDVNESYLIAKKNSARKHVICEEFIDKPIIVAKYFVIDGRIALTSLSDTHSHVQNGKRLYINGKRFPSIYYDEFIETADKKLRLFISGLKIKNGPLSFSGFYDDGVFRFIDPSFRMGGAQDWLIVEKIAGVNISKLMTNFALTGVMGDSNLIQKLVKKFIEKISTMFYVIVVSGKIEKISGLEYLSNYKTVIGYHLAHKEGDMVSKIGTADHVVMRILMVADNSEELISDYLSIKSKLQVLDEHGENMIIDSFDPRKFF